ncbi:MAG: hypothetical protein WC868_05705 [Bacteroidales bacterium]
MTNILKNNAFHILGLDVTVSQKELLKRSKEIINRLKADEYPTYDFDIGLFKDFRTEHSVKEAMQKLQNTKKEIKDYFFWLQISDHHDEEALNFIKKMDYQSAIDLWGKVSLENVGKAYFYKKNLAILYCLLLHGENNKDYLKASLDVWKEVINSDKFWASFSKIYKLHHEQTASQEIIDEFKDNAVNYLSDIYAELHHEHKDTDYVSEFQNVFSRKGEKVEKTILNPVFQTINEAVEGLEKMKVSADGILDKEESDNIKKFVAVIQSELNKLIDLGLYEDSQAKIMRDRAANAIRSVVLELHNELSERNKALKLLEVAIQMCGTESLKNKLHNEIAQIEKNIEDDVNNSMVEITGMFGGTVIFKDNFVDYRGKRIFYKDVKSISYHSTQTTTSTSVLFIPISESTSHSYNFSIKSADENISLSFSSKSEEEIWMKLITLAKHYIESLLVESMLLKIFDKGESVNIGGVEFTKDGYYKSKFFGGKEWVMWSETIYIPKYEAGQVILWKAEGEVGRSFMQIPMASPNAVILPDLVTACANYVLSLK